MQDFVNMPDIIGMPTMYNQQKFNTGIKIKFWAKPEKDSVIKVIFKPIKWNTRGVKK